MNGCESGKREQEGMRLVAFDGYLITVKVMISQLVSQLDVLIYEMSMTGNWKPPTSILGIAFSLHLLS